MGVWRLSVSGASRCGLSTDSEVEFPRSDAGHEPRVGVIPYLQCTKFANRLPLNMHHEHHFETFLAASINILDGV